MQGTMAADSGSSSSQQYSLRWNDFHSAILSSFRHLRDEEDFVDVTLACDGRSFAAHKVVLSACSPYFRRLLKANPCHHPIVILRDVHNKDMESLLRFMYNGEVHIGQEQLSDFLKAAQMLQVRGLADVPTPGVPLKNIENKVSPSSTSWSDSVVQPDNTSRERRSRRGDHNSSQTPPPPKRARSSDLYNAQMKSRTEQLLAQERSPERIGNNGHDLRDTLLSQALEGAQNTHSSTNMSGGEESSSDVSDNEMDLPRNAITKQEPLDYGSEDASVAGTNGGILDPARTPNFPGALLNLHGLLPGPSTMHGTNENFGLRRASDLMRVRATDPRPCPKCGKIYRSAHTLRTHLEDKHTICPGYRCVLCGTVAKSRNSLHSHMSRQHRGISTKDLPVLPMPNKFDPELASKLLAKAGVKISPAELRARASPTGPRRSDIKLDAKSGSAPSETSSLCGDTDADDLTVMPSHRYSDGLPLSPPNINNLANTTITKVPAVRAITAKTVESLTHNLSGKHEDYAPSAILDTYLQFMAETTFVTRGEHEDGSRPNFYFEKAISIASEKKRLQHVRLRVGVSPEQRAALHAAKLAQMNAFGSHLEGKPYDQLSPPPQAAALPPPSTTLAHHRFLQQMQRHYDEDAAHEQPLDLGKDKERPLISRLHESDYRNSDHKISLGTGEDDVVPEDEREHSGPEEEYSEDDTNRGDST